MGSFAWQLYFSSWQNLLLISIKLHAVFCFQKERQTTRGVFRYKLWIGVWVRRSRNSESRFQRREWSQESIDCWRPSSYRRNNGSGCQTHQAMRSYSRYAQVLNFNLYSDIISMWFEALSCSISVECYVIIELKDLKGREKIHRDNNDTRVSAIVQI